VRKMEIRAQDILAPVQQFAAVNFADILDKTLRALRRQSLCNSVRGEGLLDFPVRVHPCATVATTASKSEHLLLRVSRYQKCLNAGALGIAVMHTQRGTPIEQVSQGLYCPNYYSGYVT